MTELGVDFLMAAKIDKRLKKSYGSGINEKTGVNLRDSSIASRRKDAQSSIW
jgi:hypothetical protein